MSSVPLSIRFDPELLARLRRRADIRSSTPSGLAQRLIDEGLRSLDFPGIVFRDGASGRRAALVAGPDVWEVASAVRDAGSLGEASIASVAKGFEVPVGLVHIALAYYGSFAAEIDGEIEENDRAAEDAFRAWQLQQRLVS